jgi:uncharacterized protein YndB with AHSA1/START domain
MGVIEIDCEYVFAADPATVFDFLADARNEIKWNPDVRRLEKTSEGPIGFGTRFSGVYRRLGQLDSEIVEYVPPARLGFDVIGARMSMRFHFEMASEDGGTRWQAHGAFAPRGALSVLTPLMRSVLARAYRKRGDQIARGLAQL